MSYDKKKFDPDPLEPWAIFDPKKYNDKIKLGPDAK